MNHMIPTTTWMNIKNMLSKRTSYRVVVVFLANCAGQMAEVIHPSCQLATL